MSKTMENNITVPVGIYPTNAGTILVVQNGTYKEIPFPIKPFKYILSDRNTTTDNIPPKKVNLIGGGEGIVEKQEYNIIPTENRPDNTTVPSIDYTLELVKNHTEIIQNLVPEPYTPYPIFLDIETESTAGKFSKAERDEIISIQLKYPCDEKTLILMQENNKTELHILKEFLTYIKEDKNGKSPDMIVGYNLNRFDIPYIKHRIRKYAKIDKDLISMYNNLHRTKNSIYYPQWIRSKKGKQGAEIDLFKGLITMDLYLHAKTDRLLSDLPSRSLEKVAKFYGSKNIVELDKETKSNMREFMNTNKEKFLAYSEDDIIQTEYLYGIYANRIIASSNLLSCPMSMIHHATSGQKAYIVLYRECKNNKYFSVSMNKDRYSYLYNKAPKYQGALAKCHKTGYFNDIIYLDARSLYPNILHDYNISFDRYKLIDTIDLSEQDPKLICTSEENNTILYIPDNNYKCILKYQVDFLNDGFIRTMINRYNEVRNEYKRKYKEYEDKFIKYGNNNDKIQADIYNSTQEEAKILNNTFYGVLAQRYYEVADLPAAILVTAIGRWIMETMMEMFGDAVIITDTDGLMLDRTKFDMEIDKINKYLRKKQHDFFGIPYDKMKFELEFEDDGSVYVYKAKNYVLRKNKDDKITIRGSAFKGYYRAPIFRKAVEIMSSNIMKTGKYKNMTYQEALKLAINIRDCNIEQFKFTRSLRKDPSEYSGYSNIISFVYETETEGITDNEKMKRWKNKAISYIKSRFSKDSNISSFNQLVRNCSSKDQLDVVLSVIAESDNKNEAGHGKYFMLNLILKLASQGSQIEEDDIIEYYYTKTSDQISLASEVTNKNMIDFDRYETEIVGIFERFSLADPVKEDLDMDLL